MNAGLHFPLISQRQVMEQSCYQRGFISAPTQYLILMKPQYTTNAHWHVWDHNPYWGCNGKVTAERILDCIQSLPQQENIIKLSTMEWKHFLEMLPHARITQQRALLIHRPLQLYFPFFFVVLEKLKQRWCCLLKNKDIVASILLTSPPLPSFIKFSSLIHACSRADVTFLL